MRAIERSLTDEPKVNLPKLSVTFVPTEEGGYFLFSNGQVLPTQGLPPREKKILESFCSSHPTSEELTIKISVSKKTQFPDPTANLRTALSSLRRILEETCGITLARNPNNGRYFLEDVVGRADGQTSRFGNLRGPAITPPAAEALWQAEAAEGKRQLVLSLMGTVLSQWHHPDTRNKFSRNMPALVASHLPPRATFKLLIKQSARPDCPEPTPKEVEAFVQETLQEMTKAIQRLASSQKYPTAQERRLIQMLIRMGMPQNSTVQALQFAENLSQKIAHHFSREPVDFF